MIGRTPGLPQPNQVDDFRRHLEISLESARLHQAGEDLFAVGDFDGAAEVQTRGIALLEERDLLAERWKPAPMGTVEFPEQPRPRKAIRARGRR